MENQLDQIVKIRDLRVQTLRRKQLQIQAEKSAAQRQVEMAKQRLLETEQQASEEQRQQLNALKSKGAVKSHELVAYTRNQLRGVKQINDAFKAIENHKDAVHQTVVRLNEHSAKLSKAEKKLIGLQEFISTHDWSSP